MSGTCHGTYSREISSYITSPNFPLNYNNKDDCTWTAKAPVGTNILLHATNFNTQSRNDVLKVYEGINENGNLIATYSGNVIPSDTLSLGNEVHLKFSSDSSVTREGFRILLRAVSLSGTILLSYFHHPNYKCE